MLKILLRASGVVMLALCVYAPITQASVIIAGTRVVFPAKDGEVTVRMTNDNTHPALVEAWIDNGDPHSTPDKVNAPFVVTPPLFRMEEHRDQSLRIIATPAATNLPGNRESLFWLNVLEIPPKPSGQQFTGKNTLQFAIRSRLKFFYRPVNLTGDPDKAPEQITWKVVADGHGYALEAQNPTPYHVTIIKLELEIGGQTYPADSGMVDPLGTLRLSVKGLAKAPPASTPITYDSINDFGATSTHKASVSP